MFVQVIQGQVSDAELVRAAFDRWLAELAPGAAGWLGSTEGVTDDGRFVAVVRFESKEAARQNSQRVQQDQWWTDTAKLFDGEPTFRDSTEVVIDVVGDLDQAGFVQVLQGRGTDPGRARELIGDNASQWAAFRPDILGRVGVTHETGDYTMVVYFTSEKDAREGERKEPPPQQKAQLDEMDALSDGVPDFFDLRQPWLRGPRNRRAGRHRGTQT